MAIVNPMVADQSQTQRDLVRRILRVRPDVSPAQLVGILGERLLDVTQQRPRRPRLTPRRPRMGAQRGTEPVAAFSSAPRVPLPAPERAVRCTRGGG